MRSATSSGKCKTLCNSSNSPGIVCTIGVVAPPAPAAVAPANGVSFDSATQVLIPWRHAKKKKKKTEFLKVKTI